MQREKRGMRDTAIPGTGTVTINGDSAEVMVDGSGGDDDDTDDDELEDELEYELTEEGVDEDEDI